MILKYLSTRNLNLEKSFALGLKKIKDLPKFEKFSMFLWLLGPFIFLIERDPADVWLTFFALSFVIKSFVNKDWDWSQQLWFKACLLFWFVTIIAAIFSPYPIFSLHQGLVWIRFPIYAAAAQVWLGRDRDIRILMLISMFYGMILMCAILILELIISPNERLSWPYGDYIPGSYLAKFCLPIFCVLIALSSNQKNIKGIYAFLISIFTIIISIFTGERTNFLIKACAGFLATLVWKPKLVNIVFILISIVLSISFLFLVNPDIHKRYTKDFFNLLKIQQTTKKITEAEKSSNQVILSYNKSWGAWRSGIQQALETPYLGIGPSVTRKTCSSLNKENFLWIPGKNYCGNHPHNFYIQIFAETGFLGLIFASTMVVGIFLTCLSSRKYYKTCPIAATAFIIPLALFFPIQQFGSFFGQWGNLFIWFAIGYALSNNQNWNPKNF